MSKTRALIVEDNRQNLRVLSQLLSKNGVECIEVSNAMQVREMIDELADLDIIFLDLEMPRLDGFKVKDLLRSHLGSMPIIAYTAHLSEMDVVRNAGFDGFLGKPLDPTRFPELLARILNGEHVWERM
jgi:two-component system, cell cycle response regulator DivK